MVAGLVVVNVVRGAVCIRTTAGQSEVGDDCTQEQEHILPITLELRFSLIHIPVYRMMAESNPRPKSWEVRALSPTSQVPRVLLLYPSVTRLHCTRGLTGNVINSHPPFKLA